MNAQIHMRKVCTKMSQPPTSPGNCNPISSTGITLFESAIYSQSLYRECSSDAACFKVMYAYRTKDGTCGGGV